MRDVGKGMLAATFVIALAWLFLIGLGTPVNPGILAGPVLVGLWFLTIPNRY